MNTDTPETDAMEYCDAMCDPDRVVEADFARKLERERDEARGQRDALKDIFPRILIALQSGNCAADCSVDFLQEIPKEVRLVRERLQRERDEARGQLSAAKREAEYLATSIHRSEYSNVAPNWGLCDSVAGVISQIDNMYAGVRAQRDEAREKLKAQRAETAAQCAEAFLKTLNLWKP